MLIFVNRKELMGDYRNSKLANVIAWSMSIIMIVLNDCNDLDYFSWAVVRLPADIYFASRASKGPTTAINNT